MHYCSWGLSALSGHQYDDLVNGIWAETNHSCLLVVMGQRLLDCFLLNMGIMVGADGVVRMMGNDHIEADAGSLG